MCYRNICAAALCLILTFSLLVGCSSSDDKPDISAKDFSPLTSQTPMSSVSGTIPFAIMSPAFKTGQTIPKKYSCDGDDISPPLIWFGPPEETRSFTLMCDDSDAPGGTWDHWVLYNLPKEVLALPENSSSQLPEGALHGGNSWGRNDYGGPCPPSDIHRYFFRLYALDTTLDLAEGATKTELLQAMDGHILEEAEIMATYGH